MQPLPQTEFAEPVWLFSSVIPGHRANEKNVFGIVGKKNVSASKCVRSAFAAVRLLRLSGDKELTLEVSFTGRLCAGDSEDRSRDGIRVPSPPLEP